MDTRSHTHEVEIDSSAEEVWSAITNPKEIRKWFDDAEVEPKEGGAFRFANEEGVAGAPSRIDIWDPPLRFKVDTPPTPAPGGGGTPEAAPQSFDYTIESKGGRCILRMTHSGIPADSSWDPYYDATDNGWGTVFTTLRHIVEAKPGDDVEKFSVFGGTNLSIDEVWGRAFGKGGAFEEIADRAAQDLFDITTTLGDRWAGKVLFRRDPEPSRKQGGSMTLSVDQLGGAVVAVATEPMMGPKNIVAATITTFDAAYGEAADQYRKLFEESFEVEPLGA